METPELCDSCKKLEREGINLDLAYESDRDIPSDQSDDEIEEPGTPYHEEVDEKVSEEEAKLIRGVWPSVESVSNDLDDCDEKHDVEKPEEDSLTPLKRVKRAYVRLPTGKRYRISSPAPKSKSSKMWSCKEQKYDFVTLKPYGRTREEYKIVKKEMENTKVTHPGYDFSGYDIIQIDKIINGCLWRQYLHRQMEIKAECGFVNQRMLWHGSKSVDDITKHGFNEQYANSSGMFGAGIYFAKHSSKSNQYVFNTARASECPVHQDKNCKVCVRKQMLCRVTLGKSKYVYDGQRFDHAPAGFHSVTALPSNQKTGLKYPEYIVYRREQAYPEYLITYKLA